MPTTTSLPSVDELLDLAVHEARKRLPGQPEDLTLRFYDDGTCAVHHWNWEYPGNRCLRINWTEGATAQEALVTYIAALLRGALRPTPGHGPDGETATARPARPGDGDPRSVEHLVTAVFASSRTPGSGGELRSVDVHVEAHGCAVEQDGWAHTDGPPTEPAATVRDALVAYLDALRAGRLTYTPLDT